MIEQRITYALIISAFFFIVYLFAAGAGTIWLKVISAIVSILVSCLCLVILFLSKELLRQRSLWMTVAAIAIIICTVFSLILNFPSPSPV
jgi:hypothetical protein